MLHTHSHHFIKNKEVDALYFAISLLSFAEGLISIFVPFYLWSLGLSLAQIVLYFFLDALYFVILSLIFSRYFNRLTDKKLIVAGVPFLILYYALLPIAKGFGLLIFILPVLIAMYRLLFNIGYHMDFACASDNNDDDLGDEVGTQYMFVSLMQFASPLLGGLLIASNGYGVTFWVASAVVAVALIPLMFFGGHPIAMDQITNNSIYRLIFSKEYRNLAFASAGYAMEATVANLFWPLYICLLFSSTKTVGGIFSISALILAVISFATGRLVKKDRYAKVVYFTVPFIALVWVVRYLIPGESTILVTTFTYAALYAAMIVAWSGMYYRLLKKARPCGLLVLADENIFNLARVVGLVPFLLLAVLLPQATFFAVIFAISSVMIVIMGLIAKQKVA